MGARASAAVAAVVMLWLLGAGPAAAQVIEAGTTRVRPSGLVQVQFNTTSVDDEEAGVAIPATLYEFRRVRMGADVDFAQWLTGRIEVDVAHARLRVTHSWINFAVDPQLGIRVGQFKRPFGRHFLMTGREIWPIERAVRIRGLEEALRQEYARADRDVGPQFNGQLLLGETEYLLETLGYAAYDLGAEVHGTIGPTRYSGGVFNGAGQDQRDNNDGKTVAARLEYRRMPGSLLTLGGDIIRRDARLGSGAGAEEIAGTAVGLDVVWGGYRRPGQNGLLEIVGGDNLVDSEFAGFQLVGGYYWRHAGERVEGLELIARMSAADPARSLRDNSAWFLTPGLNIYFSGRNRLMANWEVYIPTDDDLRSQHALRLQAQLSY